MTHYRMTDNDPSAIIVAVNPRSGSLDEVKIYEGNQVFLQDKQNFQIRFFNPLSEKIGARISFNGRKGTDLLVLNPGQDYTLDRFLEEQKKMIFETYSVQDNNEQVEKAIINNGEIEIEFYKEKISFTPPKITFKTRDSSEITFGDNYKDYVAENLDANINYCDYQADCSLDGDFNVVGNLNVKGDLNLDWMVQEQTRGISKLKSKPLKREKKETGRVEKGTTSNQSLERVDLKFENFPFHTVAYKMMPVSAKQSETKEVRNYCDQCGYRIRKTTWRFCPKCGAQL